MTTFTGFEPANTTPVPDTLFDVLLPQLSGSELKVLLYIIRRTHGFKKETDAISLSQFTDGIKTRDGRQLDYGCGIKNRTVVSKALTDLVSKGCIYCTKGKDPSGDAAITVYAIRFNEGVVTKPYHPSIETVPPVVSKTYHGSNQSVPGVVSKTYPQETVLQDTDKQETVLQEERDVATATARSQSSHSLQETSQDDETVKREAVKPSQKDTTHGTSVHSAPGSTAMDNTRATGSGHAKRQDTNKVGTPPAPKKPPLNTVPAPEIPDKALSIMDRWDAIHKKPAPRTLKTIQAAQLLMVYDPSEDELRDCEKWLYTTDRPGKPWYRSHGVHLPDIAEKIGSWQSLQDAPPAPTNGHSESNGYRRISSFDDPNFTMDDEFYPSEKEKREYYAAQAAQQGVKA